MKKIRSFLYIDEYKMFSLYSQMFEGLPYNLTNTTCNSHSEIDSQQGPYFSGKEMSDSIYNQRETTENKILHDHIFNLFIDKLKENDTLIDISQENIDTKLSETSRSSFIEVKGYTYICDMESLSKLLTEMPDITTALNYISTNSINIDPQNKKQNIKKNITNTTNKEFTKNMLRILNFYYSDYIEFQTRLTHKESQITFTAIVNNELLRESVTLFLKKFGRITQKEITIFGTITQPLTPPQTSAMIGTQENQSVSLKSMLRGLILNIVDIEKGAIGQEANEIIIDPIAIYHEI